MRHIDGSKLRAWLEENGEDAKVNLHLKARVSIAWIDKVIAGRYNSAPRQITQMAICQATGLKREVLFPLAATGGKRRAS
jgi:hypothetical protein